MDVELNRAEAELQQEESALHSELSRLVVVGAELHKRIKSLKSGASEAAEGGVKDPALEARLKAAIVPPVDADQPFDEARAARAAAVKARKQTNVAVRAQLAAVKAQLTALSSQLQADEKVVQRLIGQAKQKAREEDEALGSENTLIPGTVAAVQVPPPPPPAPPELKRAKSTPLGVMRPPPPPKGAKDDRPSRISPRVKMQVSVDLHSDNNFFNGFSSNLSDGGLFVATVNLLPIGTETEVTFSLPSGQKVSARGVVRWVREVNDKLPDSFPGLGIQFTNLDDQAQVAIDDFVASREPLFYTEEAG